jgi:hypothetical protein
MPSAMRVLLRDATCNRQNVASSATLEAGTHLRQLIQLDVLLRLDLAQVVVRLVIFQELPLTEALQRGFDVVCAPAQLEADGRERLHHRADRLATTPDRGAGGAAEKSAEARVARGLRGGLVVNDRDLVLTPLLHEDRKCFGKSALHSRHVRHVCCSRARLYGPTVAPEMAYNTRSLPEQRSAACSHASRQEPRLDPALAALVRRVALGAAGGAATQRARLVVQRVDDVLEKRGRVLLHLHNRTPTLRAVHRIRNRNTEMARGRCAS